MLTELSIQRQNNSHVSNEKKNDFKPPSRYTELNERDNSVLLTAFLTKETGQDGGVVFH